MRRFLLGCFLLLTAGFLALAQTPTWSAVFTMSDAPLTTSCDGGDTLRRLSVFVYLDLDSNGVGGADYPPWCVWIPGAGCTPEAARFSRRNFPLAANGTIQSPVFMGWRGLDPPYGPLRVFLRVFFGASADSCYTSPVVVVPDDGTLTEIVFTRNQWQCGPAPVPRPDCFGEQMVVYLSLPDTAPHPNCLTLCDGGVLDLHAMPVPSLFRPPVIELTSGCGDSGLPAHPALNHGTWETPFETGSLWWVKLQSPDYGCATVQLLDSIPFARLDTLTVVVTDSQTVDVQWNTTREDGLVSFELLQNFHTYPIADRRVATITAQNTPAGTAYSYHHADAFYPETPRCDYVLVMRGANGQEFAAARVWADRAQIAALPAPVAPPCNFALAAFPNPFNPTTTITYTLPQTQQVTLAIYDLLGRKVTTLLNAPQPAGPHTVRFDAAAYPSGLYFARLDAGTNTTTQKLLLLK